MEIFRTIFNPTWKLNKLLYCAIKKIFRQKFIRLAVSQFRRRKKRWVSSYWVALSPLSWSKICLLTLLSILYAIKIDLQHIFYTLDLFLEKKKRKRGKRICKKMTKFKNLIIFDAFTLRNAHSRRNRSICRIHGRTKMPQLWTLANFFSEFLYILTYNSALRRHSLAKLVANESWDQDLSNAPN